MRFENESKYPLTLNGSEKSHRDFPQRTRNFSFFVQQIAINNMIKLYFQRKHNKTRSRLSSSIRSTTAIGEREGAEGADTQSEPAHLMTSARARVCVRLFIDRLCGNCAVAHMTACGWRTPVQQKHKRKTN